MVKYNYDESCSPLGAGIDYLEDVRKHEDEEEEDDYYASCSPLGAGIDYLRDYERQKEMMKRFWGTKED